MGNSSMNPSVKLRAVLRPGLYVITDSAQSRGRSNEEVVTAAVRGGASVVQLREKSLDPAALKSLAVRLLEICRAGGTTFIINDDPVLTAEIGADGVHLGPEDPSPTAARTILGSRALIGWSVKGSVEMARQAAGLGVDYVAAGSIFPTGTKAGAIVVGTGMIGQVRDAARLPVVAIGGITLANVSSVIAAGADLACVASAVVGAEDVEETCRRFVELISEARALRD